MIKIISDKLADDVKGSCTRPMVGVQRGNKMNLNTKKCSVTVVKSIAQVCKMENNVPECRSNKTVQIKSQNQRTNSGESEGK